MPHMTYASLARQIKFLTAEQQQQPVLISVFASSEFIEVSELKVIGDGIPLDEANSDILSDGRVFLQGDKFV